MDVTRYILLSQTFLFSRAIFLQLGNVVKAFLFPKIKYLALHSGLYAKYSKTCLKRTPYIPETWTNGKYISERSYFPCKIIL